MRSRGQATPLVIGFGLLLMFLSSVVFMFGRAHTAKAVAQTGADLTAVQTGRLIRDDLTVVASHEPSERETWRRSLHLRAQRLARSNGTVLVSMTFPDSDRWPPTSVQVSVESPGPMSTRLRASARAEIRAGLGGLPEAGDGPRGGEYRGPLVYRDGKPTCPAVAAAFDRMDAAAARVGIDLVVNSGYRSDAEQAVLFRRHPDPKWVAPPGRSRHREATELDIAGTQGAWIWLARNATRFGFVQRYSWEPWHFGYRPGCSAVADSVTAADAEPGRRSSSSRTRPSRSNASAVPESRRQGDDAAPSGSALPTWVPPGYRALILRGAREGGVPPVILASLLKQESGFDPRVVSPVGAQGIAQFMPGTARGMGLTDPFDPAQAIPAAGRYLGMHLRRFGSIPLALAAYNAGPGNVEKYGGIPPFRETQAYVARIMALAGDPSLTSPGEGGATVELVRIDGKAV